MRKFAAFACALIMCFCLVGCGKNDITLTTEQNDLIAEYIAGTLLKYSYDNEWKNQKLNTALNTYVPKNSQSATQTATTAAQTTNKTTTDTTNKSNVTSTTAAKTDVSTSLPQALGLSGVSITYKSFVVGDKYPEGSYVLSVPAESGCKVVAVEFTLTNNSGSEINLTTKGSSVSMKLNAGGSNVSTYSSMLKNDLLNLNNVKISAGASTVVYVLFQVNGTSATSVAGSTVSILSAGSSIGSITLN